MGLGEKRLIEKEIDEISTSGMTNVSTSEKSTKDVGEQLMVQTEYLGRVVAEGGKTTKGTRWRVWLARWSESGEPVK